MQEKKKGNFLKKRGGRIVGMGDWWEGHVV